ncbi:MAG: glycogen synthase GlgA [Alphaproteobacteria bacterium]|nr:MAG: glycogen synthase GlgA [Alphaproteobacteria bacterium]
MPQCGRGWSSERAVALDRDPIAVAALREIVPHRVVLGAAIVPERHRAGLPAEAALEFRRLAMSGVGVYLVDHPAFYDRPGSPYADPDGRDWPDNHRHFALLGWAAAALAQGADPEWRPDILHAHDWHAGLATAYLSAAGAALPSVFTVHNLAYQGFFPAAAFADLALPPGFFSIDGVEFYGGLSFLKAGLFYADQLTTVSPTYAREIQTPAFGAGLDGLLRSRADALTGILNGVDPAIWSPENDTLLPHQYGLDDTEGGKAQAKKVLQRRLALDDMPGLPLFGAVTRLSPQKGFDLLLATFPEFIASGGRLALLGSGDADLETGFAAAAAAYPGRVGIVIGYDEALSHLIMAGADVILVPSRFEPCGLTQLYALRYGALPLVRRTGGLAVALYADRASWQRVMREAMSQDFSWGAAARQYQALYTGLATHRAAAAQQRRLA